MTGARLNNMLGMLVRVGIALIVCGSFSAACAQSQDAAPDLERRVKAAFLYKFAGYVEWPERSFPGPDAPLTIAVIGDDPLADELAHLAAGRRVHDRAIAVKKVRSGQPVTDANVLFIANAAGRKLSEIIDTAKPRPVLIVTDSEGALEHGSMINFTMVDGHVRFEISVVAAEDRGLKLSSRLLAVARSVRTRTQ